MNDKQLTNSVIKAGVMSLTKLCFDNANEAGWWTNLETGEPLERNKLEMIALMHSELSEATEGIRKDIMDDHLPHRKMLEVELADTVIRIADFCGGFNLDLAGAIIEKLEYNKNRQDHKMSERLKPNGKKS